QNWPRPQIPP
uniref:Bradykinin-potentiating peptide 10b n=1 Tax=Bothrops jararaca TaxID=8724 RepID=BPPAB_BOTJA|nr:RecName: Full=Bradykinin-potentiating peptide 10b; Short=BPP-10b; AltName: Full=Angiotensin-converting enzyme inhibitor V-6-II; AltName: Full=Bradykinin-potentiating peptide V-6-II; Contains: RecName: Full=Bradykinin-potentiating peptide 10b-F; Short=BPP-10b-F [Bothrops jararaca]